MNISGSLINVGGICGNLTGGSRVDKCFVNFKGDSGIFVGAVSYTTKIYCGGLVGRVSESYVSNSYCKQSTQSSMWVNIYNNHNWFEGCEVAMGGLIGYIGLNGSLENSYAEVCQIVGTTSSLSNPQYGYEISTGGVIGKIENSLYVKNVFVTATNNAGTRKLTFEVIVNYCGYVVGNIGAYDTIENCYVENTLTTNVSTTFFEDKNLVNKNLTYDSFKTSLGWNSNVWNFSQSTYVYPTLK